MVDVPYGSYFAVLSRWVLEPPPEETPGDAAAAAAPATAASPSPPRGCALRVSAEVIFSRHTIFRSRIAINGVEELRENYAEHFLPLVHRVLVGED